MNFNETTYICKNVYSIDGILKFDGKIPVDINGRTVTYKMYSNFHELLDKNIFEVNNHGLLFYVHYDENIKEDGYYLNITTENKIIIKASNIRGIRYAFKMLNDLARKSNDGFLLPIVLIEDEPSFPIRGIVEGYYGEPWTLDEHLDMADFMDQFRLNAFMYAPKTDQYHREKWFELYPDDLFQQLLTIKNKLASKDIDFYYCISPGHAKNPEDGFQYAKDADFDRLFIKLKQVIDVGVNHFGLFFDDIDYQLSGDNLQLFKRPGIAHAHICNKVMDFLRENVIDPVLVMCPTEYHQIGATEYRNDLKQNLDEDIVVFWTGDRVCAEAITENDAKQTAEAYEKPIFIWDNFPVSDFTYGVREFIAPIKNRAANLSDYALGYLINPSLHYHISKIGMITMAHYAWNCQHYDYVKSYSIALNSVSHEFATLGEAYFEYNYPNVLSHGNLALEKQMVENHDYSAILAYMEKVSKSATQLLTINEPIIDELKPWLLRVIDEEKIIKQIIDGELNKKTLLTFLQNIKFSGGKILDYLIADKKLLTDEEFTNLLSKRRGGEWYRVFEYKRWPKH
ncbi:MAG: beta-N-acetylglucosaminidase domain-containing protein [Bacilli bacterium]